ncbi:kinase-like protein [Cenococcum geophilum]
MSPKEREQLQAELSILKELRHPNIVAYYEREHLKASQDLHLYMEYCGNGDLGKVIKSLTAKNQYAEEEFVWSILSQIVSALYRCHYGEDPPEAGRNVMGLGNNARPLKSKQAQVMILHRDLKPENIFLGADNSVKLGDFGLSKIMQSHDFASTYVGTPFYMSPEICAAEKYTLYSDIWSLGCIVYELCARAPPFNAKTHWDLIQKIKAGRVAPIPSCYSAELQKVINSCLQTVPDRRPDTAQLLNLPIVKLMRKEQEVVQLGQHLKAEKELASRAVKEARDKLVKREAELEAMRVEIDNTVRREWELKARLEIDRQVALELEKLRKTFETEVSKRVNEELTKQLSGNTLNSPEMPPRSSTPTIQPMFRPISAPSGESQSSSTSTLGTASDSPSGTDLSSLSIDSPDETTKPVTSKRSSRTPFTRAKTMFAGSNAAAVASPMDVQMGETSPMSIASLSLSPRRTAPRKNIFAAATAGERWEPELPSSPTEEEWNGDFEDDDDGLPVLPSPTRAKSAVGHRNTNEDPFKVLVAAQKPLLKPSQHRFASAPNLFVPSNAGPVVKPQSAVPIVATSPSRRKSKMPTETLGSPVRKAALANGTSAKESKENGGSGALKSKKGNEQMRIQAMRNNQLQGRTLVELQQARGIPVAAPHAVSEDEGKKALSRPPMSPVKVAEWDPEMDEMPSPFLVKTRGRPGLTK